MELKLMADVALVGFPNAGKSTLISTVSAAKPKIADYPFTTLEPHLGVVRLGSVRDGTEFVMADIPGLVEGAAEGKGLGHQFLRHIERARVLVVLLDLGAPGVGGETPDVQLRVLLSELASYRPELLQRPRVVVGSKADVAADEDALCDLVLSAATGTGVGALVQRLGPMGRTRLRPSRVRWSCTARSPKGWTCGGRARAPGSSWGVSPSGPWRSPTSTTTGRRPRRCGGSGASGSIAPWLGRESATGTRSPWAR
jgi:50S ribosomal subunit-associated GTPase HflX